MTTPNPAYTNGHIPSVPIRSGQEGSPLGWRPRQASPRKLAAQIAESIEACMAEGHDWSFADYDIADNADMIALVESHLDLEFDAPIDGFSAQEPVPMPQTRLANGTHHASPAHAEATVSANCRLMIEGHDVQVTLRTGVTPHEVELVVGTMAGMLRVYAHQPPAVAAENQPPATAAESPPPPAAQPPGEVETPYCFEHGQTYKRHEKEGQVWFSHKISNPVSGGPKWCRYERAKA